MPITLSGDLQRRGAGRAAAHVRRPGRAPPLEKCSRAASGATIVRREPVGVVGAITPWNYPQALAMFKIAPALAAGCTIVLKPSPETALDSYVFGDAAPEAGLPAGVLTRARRSRGRGRAGHPPARGQDRFHRLHRGRADHRRRVRPADPPLHAGAGRQVRRDLLRRRRPGRSSSPACPPLVHEQQPDLHHAVPHPRPAFALRRGGRRARPVHPQPGGRQPARPGHDLRADGQRGPPAAGAGLHRHRPRLSSPAGHRWQPTQRAGPRLVRRAHGVRRRRQQRPPGPRGGVRPGDRGDPVRRRDDDAVRIANDSNYGLAGSVWSADEARALAIARRVRTGTIGVNYYNSTSAPRSAA